jgi:hypothetical protein
VQPRSRRQQKLNARLQRSKLLARDARSTLLLPQTLRPRGMARARLRPIYAGAYVKTDRVRLRPPSRSRYSRTHPTYNASAKTDLARRVLWGNRRIKMVPAFRCPAQEQLSSSLVLQAKSGTGLSARPLVPSNAWPDKAGSALLVRIAQSLRPAQRTLLCESGARGKAKTRSV